MRDILTSGRFVTVDYLGEDTTDPAQATATVDAYLSLLRSYATAFRDCPGRNTPWRFRSSSPRWGSHFPVTARRSPWRTLTESSQRQTKWARGSPSMRRITPPPTRTLSIVEELRRDLPDARHGPAGVLHRTEADCRHFSGSGSRIRLCKGAYKEPAGVAFQKAAEVDASYVRA